MPNIYASQPGLLSHATTVLKAKTTDEGRVAVVLAENILRPAGGGQPQDHGELVYEGLAAPVGRITKPDGETWIEIDGPMSPTLTPGAPVQIRVDGRRRKILSRCHSLTHLGMAAVRALTPAYESKGADIADDGGGVTLYFLSEGAPDAARLYEIDCRMRSLIGQAIPIRIEQAKSLDVAAHAYPCWRVDPDNPLRGKIRIVHIEGVDANPCSGSHVSDTAEIGPFRMEGARLDGRGVTALRLTRHDVWMNW